MSQGFLRRWSQRKQAVRDGETVPTTAPTPEPALSPLPATAVAPVDALEPADPPERPAPTLDEARAVTPTSDFKPFMASDVAPEVRNTALRKLFADPRFNVMDRLDVYIDDYSQPDPLPAAMLRQMVGARALNLVPDEPGLPDAPGAGDDADGPGDQGVAQSALAPDMPAALDAATTPGGRPGTPDPQHAHSDLRLQPDPTPEPPGAGPGAR